MSAAPLMETELFDWVDLIEATPECLGFGQITTKVPISDFPIGSKFDWAWIHVTDGVLELFVEADDESSIRRFKLHYRVGDPIN